MDADHPELAGKVIATRNFTEEPDAGDNLGHGTHVAATIAAGGATHRGDAPDARLIAGKVCAARFGCLESAILAGMQWAAEQGARVVNMSLGGPDEPGTDLREQAVQRLSAEHGTLFVVASGDDGAREGVGVARHRGRRAGGRRGRPR
ncbi:Subtilase family protein [Lentzea xinjiangensis]|uniref:Subtilase family protein n=1 Tax=Lentzea xinjiangensis TaxID=402600 RepID=A0A1H9WV73_9PSEU|nr:Subtilase family protein [Lentzea xinjiangensis]